MQEFFRQLMSFHLINWKVSVKHECNDIFEVIFSVNDF